MKFCTLSLRCNSCTRGTSPFAKRDNALTAQETARRERRRETAASRPPASRSPASPGPRAASESPATVLPLARGVCLMECEVIHLLFFYFPQRKDTSDSRNHKAAVSGSHVRRGEGEGTRPGPAGHAGPLLTLSSEQDFAEGRLVGSKSEIFQHDMSLPCGLRGVVGAPRPITPSSPPLCPLACAHRLTSARQVHAHGEWGQARRTSESPVQPLRGSVLPAEPL